MSNEEVIERADLFAQRHLSCYNVLDEAGKGRTAKALNYWSKAQYWLDRLNKALENK